MDPATRRMVSRSPRVLENHRRRQAGSAPEGAAEDLDEELFLHQVEIRTDPSADLSAIFEQLVAARRVANESAAATGSTLIASGTAPIGGEDPDTTHDLRYQRIVETFGDVAHWAPPAACTCTWRWSHPRRGSSRSTASPRGCRSCWR